MSIDVSCTRRPPCARSSGPIATIDTFSVVPRPDSRLNRVREGSAAPTRSQPTIVPGGRLSAVGTDARSPSRPAAANRSKR
jgi:hypothetical protein